MSGMTNPHSKRILIVDDNLEGAEILKDFLERAETFLPQVCILDIELPVMNGYELAARLRDTRAKDSVLIALTGYGRDHDGRRSREAGFQHHLVKPVDLDRLARIVGGPT
jgi:CheY-like chemotaxis protein